MKVVHMDAVFADRTPYNITIPSFGVWGFHLAFKGARPEARQELPDGLLFLNEPTWQAAQVFAMDIRPPAAELEIKEPEVIPDRGIWHPMAPRVFENVDEYRDWLLNEHAPAIGVDPLTAPTVGLVLQKSHINTKDDAHYVSLIMELESSGALVVPTYTGALDFSQCINSYFYNAGKAIVDSVINLTGFALVGGPATQDHPKAIATLQRLNRPYLCAVPATFQARGPQPNPKPGPNPNPSPKPNPSSNPNPHPKPTTQTYP